MKLHYTTKVLSLLLVIGLLTSSFGLTSVNAQTINTNSGSRPVLIPNTKPYTAEGLKNATGRAGSANITVRALMARDNSTDVEVSTADLDRGSSAPGQLTRVQLKTFNQNDEVVYTKNYNNLTGSGYFRTTLTDVRRGQPLQIQTNVRGIDANRTGVVTILDNVKLRPDLKAERLTAPESSPVNSPVNISATVREINRDMGATANCVLYVDDAVADRALGITVGSGDAVSCAFTQRFDSTGTKRLKISVENVTPGDYDTANNSVTGQVQIIGPETQINYYAFAWEGSYEYIDRFERYWRYSDGTYSEQYDYGYNNRGTASKAQSVYLQSWTRRPAVFPINMSVKETAADGTMVKLTSYTNQSPDWEYNWTWNDGNNSYQYKEQVASRYQNGVYMYFYSYGPVDPQNAPDPGFSWFQYSRWEGKVTYYSSGFQRYWNNQIGEYSNYSWNNSGVNGTEQTTSFGSQLRLEGSFGTAGDSTVYVARPVINLISYVYETPYTPFTCTESSWNNGNQTWFEKYCREYYYKENSMYGYAEDYSQP